MQKEQSEKSEKRRVSYAHWGGSVIITSKIEASADSPQGREDSAKTWNGEEDIERREVIITL